MSSSRERIILDICDKKGKMEENACSHVSTNLTFATCGYEIIRVSEPFMMLSLLLLDLVSLIRKFQERPRGCFLNDNVLIGEVK